MTEQQEAWNGERADQPGSAVSRARDYLREVLHGGAGAFQSRYEQQIAELYGRIMSKPGFRYDAAKDPLSPMYADALEDQAPDGDAAMADERAFQRYVERLNSALPSSARYGPGLPAGGEDTQA